jgi:hypothetical protein
MFLRMNRSSKNAVASVVDEQGNRSNVVIVENKHHHRSKHYTNKNQRFVLSNIPSHIVRTWGRGGRIILPRSSGGIAFAEALQKHGIQAQVR